MRNIAGTSTNADASTLFTKVAMLLTGSMGVAALGAFAGAGITSTGAIIGLAILFLAGCIGVMVAAEKLDPGPAVVTMLAWNFVAGLFLGPCLNMYVEILGGATVMAAFLGTSGVMAVCGMIGAFSGINFSGLGKFLMIALFGLIIVGIVSIFVAFSPAIDMLYCGIGMVVFALFFMFDFFRLKQSEDTWASAIHLTMSIFLDFLNFFLYLLRFLAAASGKNRD